MRADVLALGAGQAEVLAQCRALVFAPENALALQERNNVIDKSGEARRKDIGVQVEAVRAAFVEPARDVVRDLLRRTEMIRARPDCGRADRAR